MKLKNYSILLLLSLITLFTACKEDQTVPKSTAKAITKLVFAQFTPAVQATIDETTKKITAVVPPTADVTKLIPSISVSLKAKVLPDSGKVQDFTNPVTYTVTAEDGTSVNYQVTVSRTKFSVKDITEFSFADFSPAIVAKIDAATKTITATLPSTADLTKLKPTIKISDRATINPATGTVIDFSKAVNFTVTAEDASTQVYAVTITKEAPVVASNLPSSIRYISNPLNVTDFVTVKYTWDSKGVLTKMTELSGNNTTESTFIRDKDGLITQVDVNSNGSKYSDIYQYSADKKTITIGTKTTPEMRSWVFDDRKLLVKRTITNNFTDKVTNLNLTWDSTDNLISTVNDGRYLCTITGWSGSINPLWQIAKQTQFLYTNDYNYPTAILYLSERVSTPWEFKSISSSIKNMVINTTKEDAQNRIINIKTTQSGLLAQDMTITY
jgi:hypothetical protein